MTMVPKMSTKPDDLQMSFKNIGDFFNSCFVFVPSNMLQKLVIIFILKGFTKHLQSMTGIYKAFSLGVICFY